MAHATVKGERHEVRVTQDLGDSFSLELYPRPPPGTLKKSEPYKNWPVPLCLKLRADSAAHALEFGLTHLKAMGKIEDFELEASERPPPPPPPKVAAAATQTVSAPPSQPPATAAPQDAKDSRSTDPSSKAAEK